MSPNYVHIYIYEVCVGYFLVYFTMKQSLAYHIFKVVSIGKIWELSKNKILDTHKHGSEVKQIILSKKLT